MKRLAVLPLVCLLIAACGGGHKTTTPTTQVTPAPTVAQECPAGNSHMGCATPHSLGVTPHLLAPAGHLFPDVSSYQGHPNWAAAKPHISGAYVKAFEYSEDPDFAWNVGQLKALGIKWGAYYFVRSCSAGGFIAALRSVGGPSSLPPVIDMEVPAAAGCAPSLESQIHAAFGRSAVIYTAPGTWPGGSNAGLPVWQATYGSGFSAIWTPVEAWQFTDGTYGSPVSIPGIGTGDVSVDYGLLSMVPAPLPKPPSMNYNWFVTSPVPERQTVIAYDGARQHPTKYATYLNDTLRPDLLGFAQRLVYLATHVHGTVKKPNYNWDHAGGRVQELLHRAQGDSCSSWAKCL